MEPFTEVKIEIYIPEAYVANACAMPYIWRMLVGSAITIIVSR